MFWGLFATFDILCPFWRENGRGRQNGAKKLAHVGVLLGQLLSQNKVSKIYRLGPSLIPRW